MRFDNTPARLNQCGTLHSTPGEIISPTAVQSLAASRAFFTVLNTCGKASLMLHPVHVRNTGLTAVWE
jgi:hypothetical protein